MNRTIKRIAVAATTAVALFTGISPASAATTERSDACSTQACGSGTFTYTDHTGNGYYLGMYGAMSVRFQCNGTYKKVGIRLQSTDSFGDVYNGPVHTTDICGRYFEFDGLLYHANEAIDSWRVIIVAWDKSGHEHKISGNLQHA